MEAEGDPAAELRWRRALAARATRARGRRTLARLLDAAVAEFAAHGYRGARVSQVARVAGTSHGTFYVYFEDKADLLVAALDDVRADLDEVLLAAPTLVAGAAGRPPLEAWLWQACTRLQQHAGLLGALTDAVIDGRDLRLERAAHEMVDGWTRALAERIRASDAHDVDPDAAAGFLVHLLAAANRAAATGELHDPTAGLPEALAEVVQRSLFGNAGPATVVGRQASAGSA